MESDPAVVHVCQFTSPSHLRCESRLSSKVESVRTLKIIRLPKPVHGGDVKNGLSLHCGRGRVSEALKTLAPGLASSLQVRCVPTYTAISLSMSLSVVCGFHDTT
jgi:hypothetical protein